MKVILAILLACSLCRAEDAAKKAEEQAAMLGTRIAQIEKDYGDEQTLRSTIVSHFVGGASAKDEKALQTALDLALEHVKGAVGALTEEMAKRKKNVDATKQPLAQSDMEKKSLRQLIQDYSQLMVIDFAFQDHNLNARVKEGLGHVHTHARASHDSLEQMTW